MTISIKSTAALATSLLMLSGPIAQAAEASTAPTPADNLDAALTAGSLGLGAEASWLLVPKKLALRFGAHRYNYHHDTSSDSIDYAGQLKLGSENLVLDWHPFEGNFRLSAGVVHNGNKLQMTGQPSGGSYTLNGNTYTAAQVGTLTADVNFRSTAPYLGLGWGDATQAAGFHVIGDFGLVPQGSPRVRLTADGSLSSDPLFAQNLLDAQTKLQNDLNAFKWYPVIQLGVAYRF